MTLSNVCAVKEVKEVLEAMKAWPATFDKFKNSLVKEITREHVAKMVLYDKRERMFRPNEASQYALVYTCVNGQVEDRMRPQGAVPSSHTSVMQCFLLMGTAFVRHRVTA